MYPLLVKFDVFRKQPARKKSASNYIYRNVQNDDIMGNAYARAIKPDVMPGPDCVPTFDPMLGFESRKERVMIATVEEMESAKLPLEDRDYCAHKLLKYRACRADTFPFVYKCHHEKHDYLTCEYEDYVLRMKEFERERRLRERQKQIEKQGA